jgi:translocation and assembly module TamB
LHTTSGARWIVGKAESAVGLQVKSLQGDLAGGLDLQRVRFANDGVDVSAARLAVSVDIDVLPLSVEIVDLAADNVEVVIYEGEPDAEPSRDPAEVLKSLVLPVPVRVSNLRVAGLNVRAADLDEVIDSLELVGTWHEKIEIERLDVTTEELSASLRGDLDLQGDNLFAAQVDARLSPGLTRLRETQRLALSGAGDPAGVDFEARLGAIATAVGEVRWQDELTAAVSIVLAGFDPADMVSEWPEGFPLDGRIEASIDDERLAVRDTVLEIVGTEARLRIDAAFDRMTEEISGHLRWEQLRWPLPQADARVHSETGDLRLQGTRDSWTVDGSIAVIAADLPQGRFVIAGAGTREGVEGRILDSDIFGGHAAGEAAYSWTGAGAWSVNLALRDVSLGAFLPDWPAVVTGRVEGRGTSEPFVLQAALQDVNGTLHDLDILANGAVAYGAQGFVAREVLLEHGDSRVTLDGKLMQPDGMTIDAYIADAGVYTEAASGEINLTGSASVIESLMTLSAAIESPLLLIGNRELTDLLLKLEASDVGQSLTVSGAHLGTDFSLSVAGAFDDWSAPLDSRFEGIIDGFEIDLGDEHAMTLGSEASLSFSTSDASLQEFCIADLTGASLCSNASWKRDSDYSIDLELADVPLTILEHVVETRLDFDQHVGGRLTWRHDASGTGGSGRLRVSAGTVGPLDDPESRVATGDGRVDFEIRNGQLLSGDLELPLPERGHVTGSFAVLDVTRPTTSKVTGDLNIDLFNIRVLSKLSPLLDSASGALRAKLAIAGTVTQPAVTGDLVIEEGRFIYLPIGLDVESVNLAGSMDSDRRFELSGTFRAGDGYGELASSADYSNADEPGLHFSMRGKDLTLVDVPDVLIRIDPDIDVVLSRDALTINGEVAVPHALIKPTNLVTGRVNESEDIVVVAGELPESPEEEPKTNGLDYRGELRVVLGDDIVVGLDLATARITGDATFIWQGDAIPIADGRYRVGGNIEAFGQVLDIVEGSVRFPRVPADQPFIRIAAEREIFGNTAVKRAGVLIDGPVRRPIIEPYTVPLTTEERALTLLVTGSDFDVEHGVGAIDFGTYIAPRLFVSYGIGVFERENIISARFDLSKKFGIKASSGSKESGIDLNYRFEN